MMNDELNQQRVPTCKNSRTARRNGLIRLAFIVCHSSFIILLNSCAPSRQNGYLLYSNSVRGNRAVSSEELEALIPQKPNRRLLRTPFTFPLWIYQGASRNYKPDSAVAELAALTTQFERQSEELVDDPNGLKKLNRRFNRQARRLRRYVEEGNWWMRNLGEKPVYFLPLDAQSNAAKMQQYLRLTRGFFRAQVDYSVDTLLDGRVRVNYLVNEDAPYVLRSVTYDIADPAVRNLVESEKAQSFLKVGDRFDGENNDKEKARLEEQLRNNGYYEFNRNYIRLSSVQDTAAAVVAADPNATQVDLTVRILNPPRQAAHPVYQIGDVKVIINANEAPDAPVRTFVGDTVVQNGVAYFYRDRPYPTRLLDSKIRLRPNQLYSLAKYNSTQQQLFLLNQFKFVNINFTDTTARRLRTEIRAIPLDKYELTTEGGLFVLYQGQGYPGPFANLTFRVRNLFGGLETFETNLRAGIEAQTGFTDPTTSRNVYWAQELGLTSSLIFPQILFPGPIRFTFNDLNPRTQVSLGYNYTNRPDFLRTTLRSTLSYNWQRLPHHQYSFFLTDLNFINSSFTGGENPKLRQDFRQRLEVLRDAGNRVLYNSFLPSVASNMSFAYTYNTNVFGQNRRANFFRTTLESGGTTLNFFSDAALRRFISQTGLQLFKYLRLTLDYRHYIPLRTYTTLAFRVNTGLLLSYGPDRSAPYEKYFFAGGSNSIRAWRPRRLGPGSAFPQAKDTDRRLPTFRKDPRDSTKFLPQFDYTFEQPGDFLLEGSAELRWRYFHFGADVNGALFIDAGNVWTLRPNDPNRDGEEFRLNRLVPDIAVGMGTGVRVDFSYFIIRFDFGAKVWDPARRYYDKAQDRIIDERFILPQFSFRNLSRGPNPLVVNFGIGYPF